MGISSFSAFSLGFSHMIIINAIIFATAIKETLCSIFRSFRIVASDCAIQQIHDDEHGYGRIKISLPSQLTNLPFVDDHEMMRKSPPFTFLSCSLIRKSVQFACVFCWMGLTSKSFHSSICFIDQWLDY